MNGEHLIAQYHVDIAITIGQIWCIDENFVFILFAKSECVHYENDAVSRLVGNVAAAVNPSDNEAVMWINQERWRWLSTRIYERIGLWTDPSSIPTASKARLCSLTILDRKPTKTEF